MFSKFSNQIILDLKKFRTRYLLMPKSCSKEQVKVTLGSYKILLEAYKWRLKLLIGRILQVNTKKEFYKNVIKLNKFYFYLES